MGKAYAYRLIDSAHIKEVLSPIGDIQPVNESQARSLTKLSRHSKKFAANQPGNIKEYPRLSEMFGSARKKVKSHVENPLTWFAQCVNLLTML